ncbi:MAG: hypothetical protein RMK74_13880 [Myxococcales bacterium]|nr:hypothetical protein [Myxococcales bacterium]
MAPVDRQRWRLWPGEEVVWQGRRADVARPRPFTLGPAALVALAVVFALFAALLQHVGLPGSGESASLAVLMLTTGVAIAIAPRYLHDPVEYLVTDRRVLWKRGRLVRSIDRNALSFIRIRRHRTARAVGHVDLVRSVPFGPFARPQRLTLHDVPDPDRLVALLRGAETTELLGDTDVPLSERLDPDETLEWYARPEGLSLGVREVATTLLGLAVTAVALYHASAVFGILRDLEERGLPVHSTAWALLFAAASITFVLLATTGVVLVWWGLVRARSLARDTEYLLTDRRLIIRRGRTELIVDRRRIVDVADTPAFGGLRHVFLVLDAPGSRALALSGALGNLLPARDSVPPVLYEVRDVEEVRSRLGARSRVES